MSLVQRVELHLNSTVGWCFHRGNMNKAKESFFHVYFEQYQLRSNIAIDPLKINLDNKMQLAYYCASCGVQL